MPEILSQLLMPLPVSRAALNSYERGQKKRMSDARNACMPVFFLALFPLFLVYLKRRDGAYTAVSESVQSVCVCVCVEGGVPAACVNINSERVCVHFPVLVPRVRYVCSLKCTSSSDKKISFLPLRCLWMRLYCCI